jgi:drug/metabolite transporter (DMT)-like permease
MRVATLVGIVLILIGGYFLFTGGSITTKREVVDVGPLEVSAEEQHPVRPWAAGLALLGGVALVVAGVRHKPS